MGAPEVCRQPASAHFPSPAPGAQRRQVWGMSLDPTQRSDGSLWSPGATDAPTGEAGSEAGAIPGWETGPLPHPGSPHLAGAASTRHRVKGSRRKELRAGQASAFRWCAFQGVEMTCVPSPGGEALQKPPTAGPPLHKPGNRGTGRDTDSFVSPTDAGQGRRVSDTERGGGHLMGTPLPLNPPSSLD